MAMEESFKICNTVCRICLEEGEVLGLITNCEGLLEKLNTVCSAVIQNLKLTKEAFICNDCNVQIKKLANFKEMIELSKAKITHSWKDDQDKNNICRLCLVVAKTLYEKEWKDYLNLFTESGIQLATDIKFPSKLCPKCFDILKELHMFNTSCLDKENIIISFYENKKCRLNNKDLLKVNDIRWDNFFKGLNSSCNKENNLAIVQPENDSDNVTEKVENKLVQQIQEDWSSESENESGFTKKDKIENDLLDISKNVLTPNCNDEEKTSRVTNLPTQKSSSVLEFEGDVGEKGNIASRSLQKDTSEHDNKLLDTERENTDPNFKDIFQSKVKNSALQIQEEWASDSENEGMSEKINSQDKSNLLVNNQDKKPKKNNAPIIISNIEITDNINSFLNNFRKNELQINRNAPKDTGTKGNEVVNNLVPLNNPFVNNIQQQNHLSDIQMDWASDIENEEENIGLTNDIAAVTKVQYKDNNVFEIYCENNGNSTSKNTEYDVRKFTHHKEQYSSVHSKAIDDNLKNKQNEETETGNSSGMYFCYSYLPHCDSQENNTSKIDLVADINKKFLNIVNPKTSEQNEEVIEELTIIVESKDTDKVKEDGPEKDNSHKCSTSQIETQDLETVDTLYLTDVEKQIVGTKIIKTRVKVNNISNVNYSSDNEDIIISKSSPVIRKLPTESYQSDSSSLPITNRGIKNRQDPDKVWMDLISGSKKPRMTTKDEIWEELTGKKVGSADSKRVTRKYKRRRKVNEEIIPLFGDDGGGSSKEPKIEDEEEEGEREIIRCPLCKLKLKSIDAYKVHAAIHKMLNTIAKYKCHHCPFQAKTEALLQGHMLTHLDLTLQYDCITCGLVFPRKPKLLYHCVQNHFNEDGTGLANNTCMVRNVQSNDEYLECMWCSFQSTDGKDFDGHMEEHKLSKTNNVQYNLLKCHKCGLMTKIVDRLNSHLETCQGLRPVDGCLIPYQKCRFCDFTGVNNKSLLMHCKMKHKDKLIEKEVSAEDQPNNTQLDTKSVVVEKGLATTEDHNTEVLVGTPAPSISQSNSIMTDDILITSESHKIEEPINKITSRETQTNASTEDKAKEDLNTSENSQSEVAIVTNAPPLGQNYSFNTNADLDRLLTCNQCHYVTQRQSCLSTHKKHVHSKNRMECPHCPFETTYYGSYRNHLKTRHNIDVMVDLHTE